MSPWVGAACIGVCWAQPKLVVTLDAASLRGVAKPVRSATGATVWEKIPVTSPPGGRVSGRLPCPARPWRSGPSG